MRRCRLLGLAVLAVACAAGPLLAKGPSEPLRLPAPEAGEPPPLPTPAPAAPTASKPPQPTPAVETLPSPPLTRLPPIHPPAPYAGRPPASKRSLAVEAPLEPLSPVEPPLVSSEAAPPATGIGQISFCEFCGDGCVGGSCCGVCGQSSRFGRFARAVYRGVCCPDPCYEPRWRPLADSAFFTAAVRPKNQQRFRWDYAEDLLRADRAEYFSARAGGAPGRGLAVAPEAIDYDELRHYTEVAHGSFGAWVDYSYRSLDADGAHHAGFGDLTIGTKTMLFDTHLVQIAFQFQTHIPQGASNKALGVGHTSLEPGLIFGLNLTPISYMQVELNEWIPLGGDDTYAGAVFRYNLAYNRVLAEPHPCVPLIGTLELNGWRFQDGAFTGPGAVASLPASGESYLHAAVGVRTFICDRVDFGVAYSTPLTNDGWAETLVRSELRFRY